MLTLTSIGGLNEDLFLNEIIMFLRVVKKHDHPFWSSLFISVDPLTGLIDCKEDNLSVKMTWEQGRKKQKHRYHLLRPTVNTCSAYLHPKQLSNQLA